MPTKLQLTQGRSRDFTRQTPNDDGTYGGIYAGTEIITYTVWPSDDEVPVLTLAGAPNAWLDATSTAWLIGFNDAQTAALTPGFYRLLVTAPVATGRTGVLFDGTLEAIAGGGTIIPTPTPLVTDTYAGRLLAGFGLTSDQWEALSDLILAASQAVRRDCLDRDFTLGTYTEDLTVAYDGYIRLAQIPVNQVLRVQSRPQTALTVSNTSTAVQNARVSYVLTGDLASGQTVTGLALNWWASGVPTTQTLTFVVGETIATLAAAITAVGSGWSGIADLTLGQLPVTELIGTSLAYGASGDSNAELKVYSQDLAHIRWHPDDGQKTGMLWVGRRPTSQWGRWGPGGDDIDTFDYTDDPVRITYSAGFTIIPPIVQQATVEVLQAGLSRLNSDPILYSETGGEYSYVFEKPMALMSPATAQALARWKLWNA